MIKKTNSNVSRLARHARVRKKVSGTAELPRLCVFRSLKNIYAQIIDDTAGKTLASAETKTPQRRSAHLLQSALLTPVFPRLYSTEADMYITAELQNSQKALVRAA